LLCPLGILYIWISSQKKAGFARTVLLLIGFLGNPTFSFVNTRVLFIHTKHDISDLEQHRVYPNLEVQLNAPIKTTEILKKYFPSIIRKIVNNIRAVFSFKVWKKLFPLDIIFLFFLFASCLYRRRCNNVRYNFFRWGVFLFIFGNIGIVSIITHLTRLYIPLQPLIYIVGINEVLVFFGNSSAGYLKKLKPVVLCIMILVGVFRFCDTLATYEKSPPAVSVIDKESYELLQKVTTRESIIVSDISDEIVLHVGCRSIRLPAFCVDILEINNEYLPIDYVLISSKLMPAYNYSDYGNFLNSEAFLEKFKLMMVLPNGSSLYEKARRIY